MRSHALRAIQRKAKYRYLRFVFVNSVSGFRAGFYSLQYSNDGGTTKYPLSNMTSNTTPSPLVASANDESDSAAWHSFDSDAASYWGTSAGASAGAYIQIDFGAGNGILPNWLQYYTTKFGTNDYSPTGFTLYGSNTGAFTGEEVALHSETGLSGNATKTQVTWSW